MGTTRKFLRGMDKVTLSSIGKASKLQKVVSTVTAMGFVLQPIAALASSYDRLDGGKNERVNDHVTNIWAGTVVDDVAMNVFKKFEVSANDIANMYFKKNASDTDVNNLVNLVFDKINVNGTVNAIQNSKIGGNLFFLSSDGLAVSGSGMINAGSLTVMTPTPDHLVQAGLASWVDKEGGEISNAFGGSKDINALQKAYLVANWKAIEAMNIPINKMGNITVKGRINTTNGIKFKAAHIDISKDTDSKSNPKNINPVLKSGILDFSSMVNTTDENGKTVNANIQNLTAAEAMDGSGDIVLSAVAESVNVKDDNFAVLGTGVTDYNAVQADITVGEGAQIIANKQGETQGNVKITAEAFVGKGQGSLFDIESKLDEISADDLIGTMAKTVAKVDIDGKVEGNKIDIQANAENKYVNGSISNMNNFAGSLIKSFIPLDSDVNYVVMENKAEVNIGEKAELTAHATDGLETTTDDGEVTVNNSALNITANANMKASAGSAAAASKLGMKKLLKNNGNDLGQVVPNAGVTYLETDNQANVSIKGSVTSAGGSNIAAKAEIEAEAAAAADAPSPVGKLDSNNFVNAAVTIADIKNSAQVDIASAVEASDGLRVDAKSKGSYTTAAEVNAGETSMANTAINITDVNSSAKVNINGSLKAKNIYISAQNDVENEFTANNSTGMSKFAAKMATKKLTAIGGLMGQAKKKSLKAPQGLSKLGEMFTVGASVGVINETNKADVTIGKNAVINATGTNKDEGKLNIAANTNLAGSYINVSGKSSNYKDKTDQQVMVNASVLVSNMDSSANIVVEAGEKDNGKHAVLQGKDITVNAGSEFTYARPQKMVADLKDLLEDIKTAYEADKAVLEAVEKLLQLDAADEENYFKNPSEAGAMEFFGNLQELADLVNSSAVDANMEGMEAVTSLPSAILAFVDGSKYANFYVASSTAGRDGSTGGNAAQLAVAGAVNVNQLANNAQVIIGRNAVIKASDGDVALNAKAVQQDVTLNGKMKYVVPGVTSAGGGVVAVGGNVGVHHSDVNSVVAVAGGADISGENINIGAENDVLHIAATYGGGKGGSIGVSGMAAYMEGASDSIAAVDDKAKLEAKNKLAVTAENDTNIQNIIAEFAKAGGSAAGASVGYVDYKVNNIAAVANIDKNAVRAADDEVSDLNTLLNGKLKRETLQLGNDASDEAGSITAKNVSVDAKTTGVIDNITVAGSITGGKSSMTGSKQLKLPVNITGAGSASVNIISGNTAALLEDTTVTITATADEKAKGQGAMNVAASDDSMVGAYSGAAALKKQSLTASKGAGVALAGAVAYNQVENGVIAQLKNVQIKDAKSISNEARKEGAQVAAGLAAEVNTSLTSGSTSVNGTANASANEITNKVHAVMNNVATSTAGGDKTDIANVAQDKDIQIAGGITAQYAKNGGLGVGLAASYQDVTNDIQSKIIGGNLQNVGKLQAYAATQLVQVGTAVSVGVQQGQSANGVEGAVAINNLTNNVGVTIDGATINADSVDAKAFDGKINATITGNENAQETANKHQEALKKDGFDVDGADAMDDVNGVERDENGNVKTSQGSDVDTKDSELGKTSKDKDGVEKAEDGKEVKDFTASNKGNLIITGATSAAINLSGQGKVTLGGAVSTNDIKNNFTTKISGGTITANGVNGVTAEAKSDTLMIGVAAGVAASTGQTGAGLAGSASVMQLQNKTTATIEKTAINAAKTSVNAATSSRLINITGQVSATKGKVAAGLTTATNVLDNTTGAYIKGATLKGKDDSSATEVDVNAENKSDAYAIAVGVAASANQSGGAANGAVAVNKGVNNTEAVIDAAENTRTTITNAGKISVNALDETKLKAISGGVTFSSGYAGVGGAVSYNQIGEADKQQRITAQVNNTNITTAADNADITVASQDKSDMLAMAAGLAATTGQTGAAAQGSAATTILHKNNEASMTGTNIDKGTNAKNAKLKLQAESVARVLTSADAAALTQGNAAGSAAVAVTNSKSDTKASISGGEMNLKNGKVQADSKVDIINVGIGVAAATGQGGSLAGNVAVNNIGNNTTASITSANMNASGTIGVLADSKEHIRNYAGALAATVGQGYAAGGLSTAVNVISGNTKATVSDSAITASGNDDVVNVKKYTKDKEDNLNLTGFVVNADSKHEIDNVVVTAGGAVTDTFAVGATGTVSVNTIKGATEAGVTNTDVNAGGTVGDKADVSVRASDNTEIDSHVGSAAIAASVNGGVGVGIASDSNIMSREVTAKLTGGTDNKTVNADKLTVNAFNKHDITSSTTGVAVGAGTYAGVGVAGTISVVKNDAVTTAEVDKITGKNNGFTVNADHVNKLLAISNAAALGGAVGGASVGAGVSVVQDGSTTQAALKNSELDHYGQNAEDSVTAHNDTELTSSTASGAASISIGAGVSDVVAINNIDNTVQTTVESSKIGATNKAAAMNIGAANDLTTKFVAVSAAGGLVGVGMGVGVNTIDTSVVTNVTGGSINTNQLAVTAAENRNITQTAISAGVGAIGGNATVMVTNIGSEVNSKYGLTSAETVDKNGDAKTTTDVMKDEEKADISGAFTKTNEAATAQDNLFANIDTSKVLGDKATITTKGADGSSADSKLSLNSGVNAADTKTGVQANKGGLASAQGVKVNVSNAAITAGTAEIKADAVTNADVTVGAANAGVTSIGSTVGVLDVKRNSGVNITGGKITADKLTIGSDQSGTAKLNVYQAAVSENNLGLFYSGVHLHGKNDINSLGAQLSGKDGISITTNDTTSAALQTIGVSAALSKNVNIFVVDGKNESNSTITVDKDEKNNNSELKSENGNVTVEAKHGNGTTTTMEAEIIPVAVAGMASGLGFNAKVEDNSKTNISVGDNQKFTGNTIDIKAENNSVNKVSSVTLNAALGAAIGATGVQVKGSAGSELQVGSNNTFKAGTVNLGAKANVINDAKITAVGAGFGSFMVNWATASGGTDVKVDVGDNTYNANIINIKGESVIEQHANATGLVGGMYTSGTNLAKVDSKENVEVKAGGNNANNSDAANNTVNITANGVINQKVESNGYGGAYVDASPAAAITKSNITSHTDAKLTGTWQAKKLDVNAVHDNNVSLKTDAVKAAVVGLSGVWSFSDVQNDTNVTLENAAITTEGDVEVNAQNKITYKNEVLGGGYGAVSGNAMDAKDTFALRSNVGLTNSSITTKGKVDISAITGAGLNNDGKPNAAINKNVTLKSAGLVAGSLAFSQDEYTVDNKITVDAGSAISTTGNSTRKSDNDINLKAYDVVGFTDVATADTQGGAVGAASTKLDSTFNRSNTITVNGRLDSNYDANIESGGDDSVMNVTLKSNAYNKTAAPIVANPGLKYSMTQNNRVIIGARSDAAENIKTTRNINLTGDAGNTTIATQSESYKWTQGGTTSNSSLASTADGTQSKDDKLNNGVEVNGKLLAGKNDKLEIEITDGTDDFEASVKDSLNKYAETNINAEKKAYEDAKAAYEDYDKKNSVDSKRNTYNKAKETYDSATSIAKLLNDQKSADGGADKLKQIADAKKSTLDTAATAWWNEKKNNEGKVIITVGSETKTFNSVTEFLNQGTGDIKKQLLAASSTEEAANAFVQKITEYNTAQAAYNQVNGALTTSADAAGVTFDSTNNKYVVSKKVNQAYKDAEDAYYKIVGSPDGTIKGDDTYKSLINTLKTAEKAYDAALADKNALIESVNNQIKNESSKNFVNVKASDWFEEQNDGSVMNSLGLKNYAQGLTDRLAELEELIQTYGGSAAEESFKAEKSRLQNELIALGLGYYEKTENGQNAAFVYDDSSSIVPTVDLKNILVTGGNINIKGGKLSGQGEMKAVGNPQVEITNKSKYYLNINDITIDGDGGNVKFNEAAVKSGNGLTVNDSPGKLVGGDKSNALIKITSTAAKASAEEIYTPDVGIAGTIYNQFGRVEVNNQNNSVYIASQLKDKNGNIEQNGGSIKAREIVLTAGGSITQGYNDGIVNIGGNPHYAVSSDNYDPVKKIQEALVKALSDKTALAKYRLGFKTTQDLTNFLKQYVDTSLSDAAALEIAQKLTDSGTKQQAGMYASGAIYINAANVNINGTVQSGFDTYKVDVDQSLLKQRLTQNYDATTDFKTDAWLVTSGTDGVVYDAKAGKYVYNVSAWYNPATGEIFTEDIDQSGGGRIHIMGAVASTGGGKLVALDGGATVSINNTGNQTLNVGAINADKVKGEITIIDTNIKDSNSANGYQTTVYTRDKVEQGNATYDPKTGQMYIWTNGESSQVITSYKAEYDSKWFGLKKKDWEDQLSQIDKVQTGYDKLNKVQTTRGDVINNETLEGSYIGDKFGNTATDATSGNTYQISFERSGKKQQGTNADGKLLYWTTDPNGKKVLTTNEKTGDVANEPYYLKDENGNDVYEVTRSDFVTTKKKKFGGLWGSHVTTTWKETSGMLTSYDFGLKADNEIGIEFIGNKEGGIVGIESGGDIKLNGDIRANDVTIKSSNGSITADNFGNSLKQATIFTDKLKLEAGTDIAVVQQGVEKALNLTATAGQNIKLNTLAGIKTGDVYLTNVSAGGDVELDIQGKVLKATQLTTSTQILRSADSNDTASEAATITAGGKLIIKAAGGIGEENNMHIISAGKYAELLAEDGDIWAKQAGDEAMKLKQVEAKNGNVHLEAAGGFVDALEENQKNNKTQDERLAEWKKQGILSDGSMKEQQEAKYKEQVDNLEAQAKSTGVLGDSFASTDDLQKAGADLIQAGKYLTEAVKSEYNAYYAARKEMYAKQAALNEAISAKNNGDASKYEGALSDYNTAFAKYAQAKKTYDDAKTAQIKLQMDKNTYAQNKQASVSQWLANYEELTHQATGEDKLAKYGWNQNQLLYALQDGIINPSAGSVSDVNKANIIGNNICLTTANGDLGKVMDDQAFSIKMTDLETLFADGSQNANAELLAKMNKLAGARGDDVTWGTSQIEVKRLTPISVKLNNTGKADDGKVTIDAPNANNIYLIAKDSKLTMDKVISKGNVRLTGQEGIDIGTIIGSNISLEGGSGDIGSSTKAVLAGLVGTNANGKINANAAGNIWLTQLTKDNLPDGVTVPENATLNPNIVLGSLAAKNITIKATGDIVSGMDKLEAGESREASGISYINASEKLTLKTEGSVGTADSGLRVKNSGGVVEIDAQNGAYLEAKGDGTLVLGTIKAGSNASDNFVVNSEGSLSVGREEVAEVKDEKGNVITPKVDAVEGSIIAGGEGDAKANVELTTANDLTFSGKVRANELTTQSYAGNIKQTTDTEAKNIEAKKLSISAIAGNIKLDNPYNVIEDIDIQGLGGSLNLVVSMDDLNLKLGSDANALSNNYGGDFTITNNKGNINVKAANTNIYGDIELTAEKDINVKRDENDTTSKLELNTNKLYDGESNKALLQKQGNIKLTAETGSVTNDGTLNANANGAEGSQADVIINAKEKVESSGKMEAINGSIGIAAGSDIDLAEVIANNGKADIKSKNGNIYLGKVNGQEVILVTKNTSKEIKAENVTAGRLDVKGNNININVNYDADVRKDGYVDIIFAGSDGSSMIENITLNIDAGQIGKGAVIEQLWAKNAQVNLAKGSLDIEKLAVENEAHFDVNGMTTSVWGVPPKRDGSNSSYWFNVDAWKNGGGWMNLVFSDKQHIQSSNGVLLHLRNYYYAYNQRFTAVDHLHQLLTENKADEYDINFKPEVVRYFRYDLYDLEQETAENAAPEEVIVEA